MGCKSLSSSVLAIRLLVVLGCFFWLSLSQNNDAKWNMGIDLQEGHLEAGSWPQATLTSCSLRRWADIKMGVMTGVCIYLLNEWVNQSISQSGQHWDRRGWRPCLCGTDLLFSDAWGEVLGADSARAELPRWGLIYTALFVCGAGRRRCWQDAEDCGSSRYRWLDYEEMGLFFLPSLMTRILISICFGWVLQKPKTTVA